MTSPGVPFSNLDNVKTIHLPTSSPPSAIGYIPPTSDGKIASLQAQVKEVSHIMLNNIEQTLKRGENLETLSTRSENLEESSILFKKSSTELKWKLWRQGLRLYGIIGCLTLFLLGIIAVVIYILVKKFD